MTLKDNKTAWWKTPLVIIVPMGLVIFVNFKYHFHMEAIHWITSGALWALGGVVAYFQIKKGGDTTGAPWWLWFVGPFVGLVWAIANAPAV